MRCVAVERLLVLCALLTALGVGLRGIEGIAPLYGGTLIAGAAIAIAQVVIPSLIRTRAPARAGVLTGAFSTSLVAGATVAAFTAIPLEHALGGWPAALAVWALPALLAAAVWIVAAGGRAEPVRAPQPHPLWRDPIAWSIAAYFALQSMSFYSTNTWMPQIMQSTGIGEGDAGALNGVMNLVQALPAFAVPVLATRARSPLGLLALVVVTTLAGLAGVLVAPHVALLWMLILGIGQGAALGLGLILPVLRGRTSDEVASLTAMAMGFGYCVAATGPALVGAVHDVTGGWFVPQLLLLAMGALQWPTALRASRA